MSGRTWRPARGRAVRASSSTDPKSRDRLSRPSPGDPRDPHEGHDTEQADDEADRQHDHRHTQAEADNHQDESDGHRRHVGENQLARLEPSTPATRWLCRHGGRTQGKRTTCASGQRYSPQMRVSTCRPGGGRRRASCERLAPAGFDVDGNGLAANKVAAESAPARSVGWALPGWAPASDARVIDHVAHAQSRQARTSMPPRT